VPLDQQVEIGTLAEEVGHLEHGREPVHEDGRIEDEIDFLPVVLVHGQRPGAQNQQNEQAGPH